MFSDILRALGTGSFVSEEKIQEQVDFKSMWIPITLEIKTI
jgi:hypothetical protein